MASQHAECETKGEIPPHTPPPVSYVASIEHLFVMCGAPLRLFEISPVDGNVFREFPVPPGFQDVGRCGMSLVGNELVIGGETGSISVIDAKTGEFLRSYPAPLDPVTALGYVPGQGVLAGGDVIGDATISPAPVYFSPSDGAVQNMLTDTGRQGGLAGGPLGNLFAWNARDQVIEEVDELSGERLDSVSAEEIFVEVGSGLGFTGRLLFFGEPNNRLLKMIDFRGHQVAKAFPAPLSPVCALAAGIDEPSIRYVNPNDFPLFISGSFRAARNYALTSGTVMLDWIQSESVQTSELFAYEFSGEYRDESFDEEIQLEQLPTDNGRFELYAIGTDNQEVPQTTPKQTALAKKFTLVLDGVPPTVLIVNPKPGDTLQEEADAGGMGFQVTANVSEDLSGLRRLLLFAKREGESEFTLQDSIELDGEVSLLHSFDWHPSGSGVYDLSVVATDRSGNEGEDTVHNIEVFLNVEPTPTPGHPVAVDAEILFASEELYAEVFSSVTVAELDGDLEPELLFGTDRTNNATDPIFQTDNGMGLFAINLDGSKVEGVWPVILNGDVRSSPAAADLDGDGLDEVVVGAYPKGIYIFDHNGNQIAMTQTQFSVISSPAIGNLDDDPDLEMVIGTSDGILVALNIDGTPVTGWPVTPPLPAAPLVFRNDIDSSPAIGDITGDGRPEVVALSDNGVLYAYHHNGTPVAGFPFVAPPTTFFTPVPTSANSGSPVLADIDGNKIPDVVVGMTNGRVYGLNGFGQMLPGFPLRLPPGADVAGPAGEGDDILSAPVVADVDGDGLLELGVVFHNGTENRSRLYLYDLSAPVENAAAPWWTFQGNTLRNGLFNGPPTGDFNRNGVIDVEDGLKFMRAWHRRSTMPGYHPTIDFDYSRTINGVDLSDFLEINRYDD
ncbi:MAG: VCBS repeat-containing protein [Candidatus Omnitrophica bacterium]|nr:VCBS repeat-containing protein [Candidatus Omnitrophota bacterium]